MQVSYNKLIWLNGKVSRELCASLDSKVKYDWFYIFLASQKQGKFYKRFYLRNAKLAPRDSDIKSCVLQYCEYILMQSSTPFLHSHNVLII